MASENAPSSRYAHRVKLVQDVVTANSELGEEAAREIAVRVLHALDRIPEKVR